ncbi:hypothetical protein GQ457_03G017200 [Hibiscus cannabinus]
MAPDSLLHQFDDLNFTAEEQDVVFAPTSTVVIPEEDPRLSLVGRVITAHEVDGVSLIRVFRAVWKPTKVLSITELQSNFFLIRLASEEVRSDILKRGPWVFNDDWFAILPLNPLFSIDEYFFTNIIIWVRILRVQIGLMFESLGRSLGACIGSVVGTDMRIIDGNMGEFMRVRINIDVTKPLRRCVALGGCVKFQYGDWLRANLKANRGGSAQPRGCICFHDEAGSSNSQSGFSSLGEEHVFDGMGVAHTGHAPFVNATPIRSVPAPATVNSPMGVEENIVGVEVSHDVLAVDGSGKVHIEQNALFGDENDAYVTKISHSDASPVGAAPEFDAIEEWLADDNDSEVPVPTDLPVKIPAKRSSGGSDPSKSKRARSIPITLSSKDLRISKAGMSSSKNSSAVEKLELDRLLHSNEIYWAQRSRVQWLTHGMNASDMNASLLRPFAADEVVFAFHDIGPDKAPGIDGFPSRIFRLHWDMIGSDFIQLCLDLLHGSVDLATFNRTVLVLIPKSCLPNSMRQFRPISLCTVIYKTISKVLVNRFKSILPLCISPNQGAFVSGRSITDNILIAHEIIHSLSSIGTGPYQGAAVKLDIEKAFERVEWSFLRDVMLRLGFDVSWVSLILRCITTVSFTVRINGSLSREFHPHCGLRQGDPLSPFLFLLCTQALSALLTAEQSPGGLVGLGASRNGPRVNHLLFADDSLIFIQNSASEAQRLKHILHIYGQASRQKVNYDKSAIFFCPKICQQDRDTISGLLAVNEVNDLRDYFGVPLSIGQNKTDALGFVRDSVNSRISSWNKQLLSFGGREVFIKSVIQSLPQYVMSCYLLPQNIIDDMT